MKENLYLAHHGVRGQKWGVRHYQNEDGSYKSGAEGRYASEVGKHKFTASNGAKVAPSKNLYIKGLRKAVYNDVGYNATKAMYRLSSIGQSKEKVQKTIDKMDRDKLAVNEYDRSVKAEKKLNNLAKKGSEEQVAKMLASLNEDYRIRQNPNTGEYLIVSAKKKEVN